MKMLQHKIRYVTRTNGTVDCRYRALHRVRKDGKVDKRFSTAFDPAKTRRLVFRINDKENV